MRPGVSGAPSSKYVRRGHVAGSHGFTARLVFERNGLAPGAGRTA